MGSSSTARKPRSVVRTCSPTWSPPSTIRGGGGIATLGGATTTVEDSAFCGNGAQEIGGAIYADQGSALAVSGTHFYGNTGGPTSGLGGGAIAVAAASGPRPGPVTGTDRKSGG